MEIPVAVIRALEFSHLICRGFRPWDAGPKNPRCRRKQTSGQARIAVWAGLENLRELQPGVEHETDGHFSGRGGIHFCAHGVGGIDFVAPTRCPPRWRAPPAAPGMSFFAGGREGFRPAMACGRVPAATMRRRSVAPGSGGGRCRQAWTMRRRPPAPPAGGGGCFSCHRVVCADFQSMVT